MDTIKKQFLLFSLLDTISFINIFIIFFSLVINTIFNIEILKQYTFIYTVTFFQSLLYFSFPISAYLHFKQKTIALIIYYIQFVFRLLFFSLSAGFILRLNKLFNNKMFYYILVTITAIIEVVRLVLNIRLHNKVKKSKNMNDIIKSE